MVTPLTDDGTRRSGLVCVPRAIVLRVSVLFSQFSFIEFPTFGSGIRKWLRFNNDGRRLKPFHTNLEHRTFRRINDRKSILTV